MNYDLYNREERYTCSHLFRLLHEPAESYRPLREFLKRSVSPGAFRIYAEVALIRDAYHARKPHAAPFMDDLVRLLMRQEAVPQCRLYSELPEELSDGSKTHPNQIRKKAGDLLTPGESRVYGAMQGMFNAKPDLAVCLEDEVILYEAKLTLDFDAQQLKRTRNIGEVWANLLYADLGYKKPPNLRVLKLGLAKFSPDVSWEEVSKIADATYGEPDRTRLALAIARSIT